MKIEKLSLKGIKNVLSREELKKIMAGSGGCTGCLAYMQTGCAIYNCKPCCQGYTCNYEDGPTGGCTIILL